MASIKEKNVYKTKINLTEQIQNNNIKKENSLTLFEDNNCEQTNTIKIYEDDYASELDVDEDYGITRRKHF